MPTEMELTLEQTQQGVSYEVSVFTMKMEILLEPTSNKLMVEHAEYDESNTYVLERFNTTAGNPVKKILLKLNLSDHRILKDGGGGECQEYELKTKDEAYKELASPKQTALGKDISNPLIVDSLLKTIWLSMHHVIAMKHWLFQSKRLQGRIVGFQKFLQLISLDLSRLATALNRLERSIHWDQQFITVNPKEHHSECSGRSRG
ncbi:hypothetical protein Tco_0012022 [Tanacetum coccineum]